ncbi:MAG: ATP synthase F1 subunit delta [Blautia sp.]|jgi:F-type H+-transporting ATPase subunit delta
MTQTAFNYAQALYALSVPEEVVLSAWESVNNCSELEAVLGNPLVSSREKAAVIERVFPKEIHNFMKVICEKGKVSLCREIFGAYETYRKKQEGKLDAVLYYVTEPKEEQLARIRDFLKEESGASKVELSLEHVPALGGGFILRAGDREYDWSLKGRLNNLAQQLIRR